jgi:hypothetical protein
MSKSKEVEDFARDRLRPYVEIPAFREYLKGQILEWEAWHRSQVEEIRRHEIARDYDKEQLDRAISQGVLDPEDKDDVYVLSYEWHKYEVTSIPENFEFKLVAEGEPVLFQEASVAAMVALFWCDINHSSKLVPDYSTLPGFDPLDPYGPFNKYLFEQWRNPVPGRYKHIHWFVDAAIKTYESRIVSGGVEETGLDSIVIVNAIQAIPEANQALQVSPPISEVTPPHVQPISTDDSLDETRIEGCSDKRVESPPGTHRHTAKERETAFDEPTDPTNAIPGERKVRQEPVAKAYGSTESDGDTVVPPAKQESQVEINDNHPKGDELPPPKYDPDSADWILSETLCDVINIKAATIAKYRRPRNCGEDRKDEFGNWNVDCVGKFRRQVNSKGSVAYYRPAMSESYRARLTYAESQKRPKS